MKQLFFIFMLIITTPLYATTMCAKNDTVVVILDPSENGISNSNKADNYTGTWSARFSYGTVAGISACLNKGGSYLGYNNVAELKDTINGETKLVVGTERYGMYCWCKMTHPTVSFWTFLAGRGNSYNCANGCAGACADDTVRTRALREGMFGSISK